MTYKEAHKKLAEMMDELSAIAQNVRPSLAKELEQAHQHIHTAYIRLDEIPYPVKTVEFKVKEPDGRAWEMTDVTRYACENEQQVYQVAKILIKYFKTEVRWNWEGSLQGHYVSA